MVVTLAELTRDLEVASAQVAVASVRGDASAEADPEGLFHQLLGLGLHEAAIRLAEAVYTGTMRSRAIERTFASLAARCVQLQHREGKQALTNQPAGFSSGGASLTPADPVTQAVAAAAWNVLRVLFDRCWQSGLYCSLHEVTIEGILAADPKFQVPAWLLESLLSADGSPSPASGAQVAGALRIYLQFGRLDDAATLSIRFLQRSAQPSSTSNQPGRACLPYGLLQELLTRLGHAPGLEGQRSTLLAVFDAANRHATQQNGVIERIYA